LTAGQGERYNPPSMLVDKMKLTPVERISRACSRRTIEAYIEKAIPVVVEGGCAHWDAVEKWSPGYLIERCGKNVVPLRYINPAGRNYDMLETTLGQYLVHAASGMAGVAQPHVSTEPIDRILPQVKDDVSWRPWIAVHMTTCVVIGANTHAAMHFHEDHNAFSCQIFGSRRFILVDPVHSAHVKPHRWTDAHFNYSTIDFARNAPEQARHDVSNIPALEAVLNPGDYVYLPVHWWHTVFADELSALVVDFLPAPMWQWTYPYPAWPVATRNLYNHHLVGWVNLVERRFMNPRPL
jgi:hypothetical protein